MPGPVIPSYNANRSLFSVNIYYLIYSRSSRLRCLVRVTVTLFRARTQKFFLPKIKKNFAPKSKISIFRVLIFSSNGQKLSELWLFYVFEWLVTVTLFRARTRLFHLTMPTVVYSQLIFII